MLPFTLPSPMGSVVSPYWNGREFVLEDRSTPVLEYSENFAGWSDDLTTLHEEAAGENHPLDQASRRDALLQVKKALPREQAVIMEIGCSSGFLLRDLRRSFPKAFILGADVVKNSLYRLAENFPGTPLVRFDLLQCPLPDCSIDVLVMLNVLEHINDDVMALHKAFNLLKPGGSLILEVPAGSYLYDAYDAELCHFRRYSLGELKNKLRHVGFTIRRISHLGFLLFPAFAAIKVLNKLFARKRTAVVRHQVHKTGSNPFLKWAMHFESTYLSNLHLPFGIRVLVVAIKASRDTDKSEYNAAS